MLRFTREWVLLKGRKAGEATPKTKEGGKTARRDTQQGSNPANQRNKSAADHHGPSDHSRKKSGDHGKTERSGEEFAEKENYLQQFRNQTSLEAVRRAQAQGADNT